MAAGKHPPQFSGTAHRRFGHQSTLSKESQQTSESVELSVLPAITTPLLSPRRPQTPLKISQDLHLLQAANLCALASLDDAEKHDEVLASKSEAATPVEVREATPLSQRTSVDRSLPFELSPEAVQVPASPTPTPTPRRATVSIPATPHTSPQHARKGSVSPRSPKAPVVPGHARIPKITLGLRADMGRLNAALEQPPRAGPFPEEDEGGSARGGTGITRSDTMKSDKWQTLQAAVMGPDRPLTATRRVSVVAAATAATVVRYMSRPSRMKLTQRSIADECLTDDSSSQSSGRYRSPTSSLFPTPMRVNRSSLTTPMTSPSPRVPSPWSAGDVALARKASPRGSTSMVRRMASVGLGHGAEPAEAVDFYKLSKEVKAPPDVLMTAYGIFKDHVRPDRPGEAGVLSWDDFGRVLCELTRCNNVEDLPEGFFKSAFTMADSNQDEGISFSEFALWYSKLAFSEVLNLTKEQQFIRALARKYRIPIYEIEDLKALFDKFDENGTGEIEYDEFWSLLATLVKQPRRTDIPAKRVKMMWKNIDVDGSGVIGFEEFLIFYKQYFGSIAMKESPFEEYYRSIRPVPGSRAAMRHGR